MSGVSAAQMALFRPQNGASGGQSVPPDAVGETLGAMYQPPIVGHAVKGVSSTNLGSYGGATSWAIKPEIDVASGEPPASPVPLSRKTFGSFFKFE